MFAAVAVGNPLDEGTPVGPLIDRAAFDGMQRALDEARAAGGTVTGGEQLAPGDDEAFYVTPALVEMPVQSGPVLRETFAPILHVMRCSSLEEAIALNNAAPQGLSSSIFTNDLREAEVFLSATVSISVEKLPGNWSAPLGVDRSGVLN